MGSYKEKLFLEKPAAVLMLAFQDAARKMGLKTQAQERFRLALYEVPLAAEKIALPVFIEIKIVALSEGTGVELNGSNLGIGGGRVKEKVDELKTFFYKEMEKPALEQERLEKIRAREERDAEDRAKDDAEDARREELYQQKIAQMKEEEEAALRRRLPAGASSGVENEAVTQRTATAGRAAPPAPGAPSLGGSGLAEELQRLAELHQTGILDDEEFKAAKRALLSR